MKKFKSITCVAIAGLAFASSTLAKETFEAPHTASPIQVDGIASDSVWAKAPWYPMDKFILGKQVDENDFSARFQVAWDKQYLYLNVELTDDVLLDIYADPLERYWDDDCLEIFIDEDRSGGDHQFNFNAFAYHVALDNQSVDIGEPVAGIDANFILLNDHVESKWQRQSKSPYKVTWEAAIKLFDDSFKMGKDNKPVELIKGKEVGFMLAYCDNDTSKERESFYGSTTIKPVNGDTNLGWKNADVFSTLTLK